MTTDIPSPQTVRPQKGDERPEPVFDSNKVIVVFVLGGPGSGKGTQSTLLAEDFNFFHLSAGDLLRVEQNREGSQYGTLIQTCIREGTIVPMKVTMTLLQNAMSVVLKENKVGLGRFLIDGFPRKMDQAIGFEEQVCISSLVLYYATTEEVMLNRLMERGKTSGREDDNVESIKKRFRTYEKDTMPVIEYYKSQGRVAEIDASTSIDEVHEYTRAIVQKLLASRELA
ncbi:hypothetical protein AX15_006111 [Amanita polypyramis BW_CC]|nr:hypothetical protein AX15_006111 [Amanita polypyramis BW_CC]